MDATYERLVANLAAAQDALVNYTRPIVEGVVAPPAPSPVPVAPGMAFFHAPNIPTLSDQPFNSDSDTRGWYLSSGTVTFADDGAAPISPSKVLQFRYQGAMVGGSAPATVAAGLGGNRLAYAGIALKHSANWQGHSSNVNKIAFYFMQGDSGSLALVAYGPPGGPYELKCELYFRNGGETRRWLAGNIAGPAVLTMGGWHVVEWQLDYAAHRLAVWLDGKAVLDYRDVKFPADGLAEFQLSPTWGGTGDQKRQTDYLWVDHVLLKGA